MNKIYVVTCLVECEILSQRVYDSRNAAMAVFETVCEEDSLWICADEDLAGHAAIGTIALAGDDAYGIQVIETWVR